MPHKKKFSRAYKEKKVRKPKKKKEKFNYRAAPYIRERLAKNEQIENRRKKLDEYKLKQQNYNDESSGEEEENPLDELLKTFSDNNIKKIDIVSDSENESKEGDDQDSNSEDIDQEDVDDDLDEQDIDEDLNEEGVDQDLDGDGTYADLDKQDIDEDSDEQDLNEDSDEQDLNEDSDEQDLDKDSDEQDLDKDSDEQDLDKDSEEQVINENTDEQDADENIPKNKIKKREKKINNASEIEELENKFGKSNKSNKLKPIDNEKICDIIKEKNEEDEETAREDAGHVKDPFTIHLRNDLDNDLYEAVSSTPVPVETGKLNWPNLGNIIYQIPKVERKLSEPDNKKLKLSILEDVTYAEHGKVPQIINKVNWNELYVKSQIQNNISRANFTNIKDDLDKNPSPLTPFQRELFSIINNYQDLLYTERTNENESQIRFLYCLHAINHVLKTRTKILHHNTKIQKAKLVGIGQIPDEYKDQGLVRPKILILVPFRHSCLKIVEMLISIFIGEEKGGSVINKLRFMEDFGSSEVIMPQKNPKPEDYEQTFKGNIDDSFRIGLSITKKAIRLYSEFYSSDIIISSLLGLRMIIGAEGEEERDYDFLASVELLIMDQMEIFFMQNWDHLLHILDHLHLQPEESHDADFSRIRSWCVNGWSKYYRQTLMFSSIQLPEIHGVFNKFCHNYAGKLKVMNLTPVGSVVQVIVQIPQIFHRFNVNDHTKAVEARFDFFTTKILPQYKDTIMNHTLIFIPSYFDYVKLRNYFRQQELSFVQICEYTRRPKVARARDMFFHSDAHFILYTERYHFFRRIKVKGIRHIIFYAPPSFSHFYSEMCNLMQEAYQNPNSGSFSNMTVTVIYCKYDVLPLTAIVGSERISRMINSDKAIHMVMTEA